MTPAELAKRNVGMVYAIAGDQWKVLGGEYDELVGDGMVGLMQAALRFDPSRFDGPFSTYAHTRVRGAMVDGYRIRNRTGQEHGKGERKELLTFDGKVPDVLTVRSAEDTALGNLELDAVLAGVARLSRRQRAAVNVVIGGGDMAEHAAAEGVSRNTADARLYEARQNLERVAA